MLKLHLKIKDSYMKNMHNLYLSDNVVSIINEEYLSNSSELVKSMRKIVKKTNQKSHKICIINSSMGTGKSTLIKKWCKNYNTLVIGARVTFCNMMASLLNLENYQTAHKPFSVIKQPRLVVQLQSILKIQGVLTSQCSITCSYQILVF